MTQTIKYTLAALSAAFLLSSCQYKELCRNHAHTVDVNVVFDWKYTPNAGADVQSMALFLYPTDGSEALRYDFQNPKGGVVRVPLGEYKAICLNSDTEDLKYVQGESCEDFLVKTFDTELLASMAAIGVKSEGAPKAPGAEDQPVMLSPDMLYRAGSNPFELTLNMQDSGYTLTLYPQQAVCHYSVEIRNVANLQYTKKVSASLSSLSSGVFLYTGSLSEELVTVPFGFVWPSSDEVHSLSGEFLTFGATLSKPNTLAVYAVLDDDSKWWYSYDVSSQIAEAPDPFDVHIVLDKLPLPKPIVNGGGFQPTVGDWETIEIDIKM